MPLDMKTYKKFIEDIQESSLSRIQSKSKKLFTKSLGKTKIEVNPDVDIGIASDGKNTGSGRNLN